MSKLTTTAMEVRLCLNFAKKCIRFEKTKAMFPLNHTQVDTRNHEIYKVTSAKTDRFAKSAIPYMQRLLNANIKTK